MPANVSRTRTCATLSPRPRRRTAAGGPGGSVSEAFLRLRDAAGRLREMEVVLRDLDRGLVDFPALRDGREVYLCWVEREEDEIAFWHDLDAGYAGREPLGP